VQFERFGQHWQYWNFANAACRFCQANVRPPNRPPDVQLVANRAHCGVVQICPPDVAQKYVALRKEHAGI
jgi:hypothetical protein